ncbi:poly(rC)-binding protein 2/3/4 [Cryptococcus deuterogattii 99/473]|uniref:Poly(RC)-binding protein 2/3/4 n=2 Tax=Cryptococcus deuterogattii TaxID=1859096 RepID=A0A0D0V712_9TREE|nr:poly(rC)-binding protein 2/3/4 [Cryptococcus deuterogattii R265]KIR26520.1 poly(rC)-binding protein 2/3/4 [Cryptococcus deuterogattii LA55]KIR35906.1 poly(rC)-binding protein 2/3/4 [Cryptococcus deuterogattii MMRL2647]KIR43136.1 poly(rC)-binding protein 2/3/4 [Cryptococcus deuterogattii Ram5]KIR75339.1 poly(rC)-binding protein 2/3/4 [Cryptococcus deuterogattii CA1014]KIR95280.1 poly(rC)-binding protein 2/3/4 [Cryptococcus deuterogattii CBS 10090]KIS01774.1 poly(rC)-binding protein 2/3/4 [C
MSASPSATAPPEASPTATPTTATTAKRPASPDNAEDSAKRPKQDQNKMADVDMQNEGSPKSAPTSEPAAPAKPDPGPQQISMRSLIVTQDASIIIGRGGAHVNEIREKSSARVTVSESIPGNPERILNVSGPLDAVAKAFGLIVRRINDEPFDVPSVPGSRAVTIKFIIPNSRMGSVIGKGGSKIKEIQEASGARLNASEAMLPGSTERVLSVSGVADAVHIAVYYIGTILLEYQDRYPANATGSYRQSQSRGPPPSSNAPPPPGMQTQQIFIPNALVGAIIGRGGSKINEIRSQSSCQIRVTDPGTTVPGGAAANPEERLVTITGYPDNINAAVALLYSRVEAERAKLVEQNAGGM